MQPITRRQQLSAACLLACTPLVGCGPEVSLLGAKAWTLLSKAAADIASKVVVSVASDWLRGALIGRAEAATLGEQARAAGVDERVAHDTARAVGVPAALEAIAGRGPLIWYRSNRTGRPVNRFDFSIRNETASTVSGSFILRVLDEQTGSVEYENREVRFDVYAGRSLELREEVRPVLRPGGKNIWVADRRGATFTSARVLVAAADVMPRQT